jgi:hypothetical protein
VVVRVSVRIHYATPQDKVKSSTQKRTGVEEM